MKYLSRVFLLITALTVVFLLGHLVDFLIERTVMHLVRKNLPLEMINISEMHFSLLRRSISARNIRVIQPQKCGNTDFVNIPALAINFHLLPFLRGQMRVRKMEITSPCVNMLFLPTGENTLSFIKLKQVPGRAFNLFIDNLEITGGRLNVIKTGDTTGKIAIRNLSVCLCGFSLPELRRKVTFDLSAVLESQGRVSPLKVHATGTPGKDGVYWEVTDSFYFFPLSLVGEFLKFSGFRLAGGSMQLQGSINLKKQLITVKQTFSLSEVQISSPPREKKLSPEFFWVIQPELLTFDFSVRMKENKESGESR